MHLCGDTKLVTDLLQLSIPALQKTSNDFTLQATTTTLPTSTSHRTCLMSEINLLPLNNMPSFSFSHLFLSWFSSPSKPPLSVDNQSSK
jgi:hypothetical protein